MADSKLFSILIPTWNNLKFLQLCVESIRKNSTYEHEILIHVNEGTDGTLEWVKAQGLAYTHSTENVGVCLALNQLRPLVTTDYILFMNDDMYVCPEWDKALYDEILAIGHKMFFLSSTLIQPRQFFCKSVIAPANYGESVETFEEERLLKEYQSLKHGDWMGATWPPNIVHRGILWEAIVWNTVPACIATPTSLPSSGKLVYVSSRALTKAGSTTSRLVPPIAW